MVSLAIRVKMARAEEMDTMAFQPAMLTPRKRKATSSQRMRGAAMIASRALPPMVVVDVQGATYSHSAASTPAWNTAIPPEVATPPAAIATMMRPKRLSGPASSATMAATSAAK